MFVFGVLMGGVFMGRNGRLVGGRSGAVFVRLSLEDERNGAEQLGCGNGRAGNKARCHG
jgi:hypothetical protein